MLSTIFWNIDTPLWQRFDGNDHNLDRQSPLTKGETERVERAVASLLPGPPDTHRVVAVEKRQVLVKSSEVVMVNGKSIELEGQEGMWKIIFTLYHWDYWLWIHKPFI